MSRLIAVILYFPHILLYLSSAERDTIYRDLYSGQKLPHSPKLWKTIGDLAEGLMISRYFRTLFYFRTRGKVSKFLRVFYPKERTFVIDRFSKIGQGLRLAHPFSTIINCEQMGTDCYINHLVTVGQKDGNKPIIGNGVEMHANCSVIGGVHIGNHVIIGAGAVVVKDVPDNAIVAGNPARIIKYRDSK